MKYHVSPTNRERLISKIGALAILGNTELKALWKAIYGTEAPPRMKRELLRYPVAYRIQEHALGGLKPTTRRLLERVADEASARRPVKVTRARQVGKGTVLIRQWGGADHEVRVLEKGVMLCRKRHRSLSEIARLITGSHWSGPLFFGLKAGAKEEAGNGAS